MTSLHELWDSNGGSLPSFAWPGGYPIVYVANDGEAFCPDCANRKNGADTRITQRPDDNLCDGWLIIGFLIHYEGEPERCCHCGAEIESAYGVPESD